jgi:hypothetical protein
MAVVYIRLKDPSNTVYFQSIFGTYSHLAWVRTENAKEGVIKIISTDDLIEEARKVLGYLRSEVEFEEIQISVNLGPNKYE